MPTLSHDEARRFYDRFGARQDRQGFYENPALADLVAHLDLGEATALAEFGCGTGRLAADLLARHLPADARYLGIDISATMVGLARARLARFGDRARVERSAGPAVLDAADASFDRFVVTYVLDLLSDDDARAVVAEARRLLVPGGLLGLVGLTHGFTPASRVVEGLWRAAYRISPRLVGGCRPIDLTAPLGRDWQITHHRRLSAFGVPSEVLVARR